MKTEAFEGRRGLLCLVQQAGRYLENVRKPQESSEQGRQTRLGFKKGPSGSGMKTFMAKGQGWW